MYRADARTGAARSLPVMRAVHITRFGGPDVLEIADVPDPMPGPGRTLVEVAAAGVNYADLLRAAGTYSGGVDLPLVPGGEVVGRAPDGRRVAALTLGGGGYAERAVVDADRMVEVPAQVDDGAALALLVQGLTAWHLLRSSGRLVAGESIVVNAAAGGVGTVVLQLARALGAGRIVAAASTEAKRDLALSLGADAAIDSAPGGYADRVRKVLGHGADLILDANGGPSLPAGLDALAPFGRLVSYGDSSRQGRPDVDPKALAERNLSVAGFWLRPALALPGAFHDPLKELLSLAADGTLKLPPSQTYALEDARQAFEDLAARRTTGKVVLTPRPHA